MQGQEYTDPLPYFIINPNNYISLHLWLRSHNLQDAGPVAPDDDNSEDSDAPLRPKGGKAAKGLNPAGAKAPGDKAARKAAAAADARQKAELELLLLDEGTLRDAAKGVRAPGLAANSGDAGKQVGVGVYVRFWRQCWVTCGLSDGHNAARKAAAAAVVWQKANLRCCCWMRARSGMLRKGCGRLGWQAVMQMLASRWDAMTCM